MIEFWMEKTADPDILVFIDGKRVDVEKFETSCAAEDIPGLIEKETEFYFVAIIPKEAIELYTLKDKKLFVQIKEKPYV